MLTGRRVLLMASAAVAGIAIAMIDSSPGWDATGITAGLLVLATCVVAAIADRRPWLWAALVGLPTPLVEVATGGSAGSFLALAFAAGGAALGWAIGRAARGSPEGSLRE